MMTYLHRVEVVLSDDAVVGLSDAAIMRLDVLQYVERLGVAEGFDGR